jgi:potassium channel subfamily K
MLKKSESLKNSLRRPRALLPDALSALLCSASTIGLGDISPVTRPARIAAVVYIPMAVAAAGDLLSNAASALLEQRQQKVYQQQLEQMLTITRLHEMDQDQSGRISRAEFLKFMLMEMALVEADELRDLDSQFDRLDKDQTGYLDTTDLALMAKYRGVPVTKRSNNETTTTATAE